LIKEKVMSMRGEIISNEYNKMVWVRDENGKEYACYAGDLVNNGKSGLSSEEKEKCLDTSQVLGDSW